MKPKLLILSDLWSHLNSDWMVSYVKKLESSFEIKLYSSRDLGEIEVSAQTENEIHNQFVYFGIDKAVEKLISVEKERVNILAFSIGGTIAWKAAMNGLLVQNLVAISSTRLRNEIEKPSGEVKLYFGDQDDNRPTNEWFEKLQVAFELVENMEHSIYQEEAFILRMCEDLNNIKYNLN